jgi:hypothetical protein
MLMIMTIGLHGRAGRPASAQSARRAGLIVQFGDGSITQRCVRFGEDALTGEELMRRARMPAIFEYSSLGPAVCKIGNDGCNYPGEGCFCQCQTLGASCTFWNYLHKTESGWRALPTGAGARIIGDGEIVAWSWAVGDGESVSAILPDVSIDQICSAVEAEPATTNTQPTVAAAPSATTALASAPTAAPPTETLPVAPTQTVLRATAQRPAAALPTATDIAVAAVAPSTTAAPAFTARPAATAEAVAASSESGASSSTNYIAFGVIALVLSWLIFVARRRARRNP